ncbi:MAG: ABC transporter ATP-binding protein [Lewinellaceae bacterium]|nr:ABC transporter ATP-binding protein [Saprospiraceae bacterium]MCB9337366.1 ABC transporter ATP-binding protein [Lewinellaceae bacterium]
MESPVKQSVDYKLLGRVLAQAKPYSLVLGVAGTLAVVLAPVAIFRPYLVQVMVDDYIFKFDIAGLTRMALLFLAVLVMESALRYVFMYSSSWVGQAVVRDLRVKVFNHITSLRLTYFDRTPIGISTTRTISDIENINQVFSQGIITIIADFLTVFVVLGVMFWVSWKLTLVCLITMPFLIAATYIFKESIKSSFQQVRAQIAKMNAFLQERLTGMRIVQIFNAEQQEMEKFKKINREYTQANINSILAYSIFYPVVEIISAASLGLMVWWGARESLGNEVSLGALVAFPLYLNMLFRPIRMLADKFNTLQMGLVASERVFDLIDRDDFIENKGTLKPEKLRGEVEFKNIWFAYSGLDYVLKDISFKINPGETLALVGSTGSGKTSIISILNRLYETQKGAIEIDGENIRDYELHALRSRMAVVLQDVFLFSGTVLENITLRNDHITREQVIEAAEMIGAHRFIEKLPGGYDYQVMERGATLSMGQRQLISFVRALVFDPDILILDEATSSIDPESESVIQYAIEKLIAKRTSIIIAHRLSTIRHANNILVLEKGQVKEFGSHEELLQIEDGRYRELYEMQFLTVGVA